MKYDRFEHEQQIMSCWNICEDLKELSIGVMEHDMTQDQIANVLIGLEELYKLKFERLFNQFELSIKELK
jgi:hypothetical protein